MNALLNQIIPGPVKIAVIGSGCSVATEATADISHYFNITHVRNIHCQLYKTRLRSANNYSFYLLIYIPFLAHRSLVCPPPQGWQTGSSFVTISSWYQLKHPLHLPTLVSFDSMSGRELGLLCRMRTSLQWYES